MAEWKHPSRASLESDKSEYTLAFVDAKTGQTETQKFAKKDDANGKRDEIRRQGGMAFVFDAFGHLA